MSTKVQKAKSLTMSHPIRSVLFSILILIPPVLAIVELFIPAGLEQSLILQTDSVVISQIFASNFIHSSVGHLMSNINGYAQAAFILALLAVIAEEEKPLLIFVLLSLTIIPVIVSYSSVLLFQDVTSLGFSGIVAAYFGALVPFSIATLSSSLSRTRIASWSIALLFANLGAAGFIQGQLLPAIISSVGAVIAVFFPYILGQGILPSVKPSISSAVANIPKSLAFIVAMVLFFRVPSIMPLFASPNGQSNIVAHLVGLLLGVFIGLLIILVNRSKQLGLSTPQTRNR